MDCGKEVAVLHVWCLGLLLDFFFVVDCEKLATIDGGIVGVEERLQAVEDAGFPVNEGSVDVKGEGFEV